MTIEVKLPLNMRVKLPPAKPRPAGQPAAYWQKKEEKVMQYFAAGIFLPTREDVCVILSRMNLSWLLPSGGCRAFAQSSWHLRHSPRLSLAPSFWPAGLSLLEMHNFRCSLCAWRIGWQPGAGKAAASERLPARSSLTNL